MRERPRWYSYVILKVPYWESTLALSCRFDREGQTMDAPSISNQRGGGMMGTDSWKTLAQAKLENLGHGEKVR